MNEITLGCVAKDAITGFQGVVVAMAHYLTGCDQACLKPQDLTDAGDTKEGRWFDLEQIEHIGEGPALPGKPAQEAAGRSGGPRHDAPPRL